LVVDALETLVVFVAMSANPSKCMRRNYARLN
jgi:hypothetical protein